MSEMMEFSNREEFRKWLCEHCLSEDGVWLLFGKSGGPKTISLPPLMIIVPKIFERYFLR